MRKNEFLNLVSSPLMNLDHTFRYSGTRLVEPESLSQHIVDTIMMGIKIIDKVNNESKSVTLSPEHYVMKAVYHDLEEVITGDIPRPLKYYNQVTLNSLRSVADDVAMSFFEAQFNDNSKAYSLWESAKDGREGYILKLVDMLVVANKVVKEVTLLNNYYMLRVAHEVVGYLNEVKSNFPKALKELFDSDSGVNKILSRLLDDAIKAMGDLLNEHENVMVDLDIYSQSMIRGCN